MKIPTRTTDYMAADSSPELDCACGPQPQNSSTESGQRPAYVLKLKFWNCVLAKIKPKKPACLVTSDALKIEPNTVVKHNWVWFDF